MSDDRVTEQLRRYGAWVEREAGFTLRSATDVAATETFVPDERIVGAAVADTSRRNRWSVARWPRPAFVALAAAAMVFVVAAVVTLRPAGDPSALYSRASDPEGPLFVLPADDADYEVSNGIINSSSARSSSTTERVWIGTPDAAGTTFRDVVQVCASRVAAECASMPTPNITRGRIEIGGRFLSVATSDDGSTVVVSDRRDLWHVSVRGAGRSDPVELATLLTEVDVDADGVPSVDVEAPRKVFATQGSVERIGTDLVHTTSFEVDGPADDRWIAVSTATGTPAASSPVVLPGLIELDEVSLTEEIIDDVTVTKLTFVLHELGTVRTLTWQASPNRLISVSGSQTPFAELTDIARSLVETSSTEWKAALPDHQTFEESQPAEDD